MTAAQVRRDPTVGFGRAEVRTVVAVPYPLTWCHQDCRSGRSRRW
ncbi:hypothetical protein [Micromonospora tarensis]|nr:hypothetical protein [Micromonospora tarensis]